MLTITFSPISMRLSMVAEPMCGNSNARLEALVAQLIDENRTQAGLIVRLQSQVAKMLQRWDGDGMPQPRKEGEGVAA